MAQRMSKRLQKEFEAIQKNAQDMKVVLPNNDLALWHVNFLGAKGTLYEGESFTLQLRFTNEYVPLILVSLLSRRKSSSSGTFQCTSTYTPTGSSVCRSCTTSGHRPWRSARSACQSCPCWAVPPKRSSLLTTLSSSKEQRAEDQRPSFGAMTMIKHEVMCHLHSYTINHLT